MIKEVRKKLSKELNLVLAERQRDEDALPTDLWKKPVRRVCPRFTNQLKQCLLTKISFESKYIMSCLTLCNLMIS